MARLTAALVTEAIRKHDGNLSAAARQLKVHRSAVRNFVTAHPELAEVLTEARETMIDGAESALYKAAKRGESWAVCFFLKTQARERGYVEHSEAELRKLIAVLETKLARLERIAEAK